MLWARFLRYQDKFGAVMAWVLQRPFTLPDWDGGKITYFPEGGWSHRL